MRRVALSILECILSCGCGQSDVLKSVLEFVGMSTSSDVLDNRERLTEECRVEHDSVRCDFPDFLELLMGVGPFVRDAIARVMVFAPSESLGNPILRLHVLPKFRCPAHLSPLSRTSHVWTLA